MTNEQTKQDAVCTPEPMAWAVVLQDGKTTLLYPPDRKPVEDGETTIIPLYPHQQSIDVEAAIQAAEHEIVNTFGCRPGDIMRKHLLKPAVHKASERSDLSVALGDQHGIPKIPDSPTTRHAVLAPSPTEPEAAIQAAAIEIWAHLVPQYVSLGIVEPGAYLLSILRKHLLVVHAEATNTAERNARAAATHIAMFVNEGGEWSIDDLAEIILKSAAVDPAVHKEEASAAPSPTEPEREQPKLLECPSCGSTDIRPDHDPNCCNLWCNDCGDDVTSHARITELEAELERLDDYSKRLEKTHLENVELLDRCASDTLHFIKVRAAADGMEADLEARQANCICSTDGSDGCAQCNYTTKILATYKQAKGNSDG